jgi:hypothetical protein
MRRFQDRDFATLNFQKKLGRPPNLDNPNSLNEKVAQQNSRDRAPIPMRRFQERELVVRKFTRKFGRPPNLNNPTTFNEKIAYKILHDRRPLLTRLQDKLQARDYVAQRVGAEYLSEVYQVCQSPHEIDWGRLPERFVIKMNHGCGMNIFVTDFVTDIPRSWVNRIESILNRWRATNLYEYELEWAYLDIRPAIFVEEMLREPDGTIALDWKFWVFDGRVEYVSVSTDQLTLRKVNYYDRNLTRQTFNRHRPNIPSEPRFPDNIDLMFSLAERLGRDLDFVRVDMYNIGGRIVFGEFCHYPDAGLVPFDPPEFDQHFASKWHWPPDYGQPSRR